MSRPTDLHPMDPHRRDPHLTDPHRRDPDSALPAAAAPGAAPPETTLEALAERYEALLFDVYGVLVHATGPLPGAPEALRWLQERGRPFFLLTNDASKLPERAAARYRGWGLPVGPAQIVPAGALLEGHFRRRGLRGRPCAVLGTEDSRAFVERAGGRVVPWEAPFEVLVVADQAGFPLLEGVDGALSGLIRRLDRGLPVHLVLPNPDLIYPKAEGFGITAGSIALVLEAALRRRYGPRAPRFQALGKPRPGLFREALRRAGTRRAVVIGDQIETDVAGAKAAGLDAALVTGGVARALPSRGPRPDWLLPRLGPPGGPHAG